MPAPANWSRKSPRTPRTGRFLKPAISPSAGLEDEFFAAVALPPDNTPLEIRTYSDEIKVAGENDPVPYVGVGLSTGPQNSFSFFVGPKDTHLLEGVNPKLGTLIDWGFFGIIAKPLFVSLNYVADHWTGHNYGWAIILVTLIINTGLIPHSSVESEIGPQDAKAAAAVEGHQRQIQEHQD